jgi:hypothetical protein
MGKDQLMEGWVGVNASIAMPRKAVARNYQIASWSILRIITPTLSPYHWGSWVLGRADDL